MNMCAFMGKDGISAFTNGAGRSTLRHLRVELGRRHQTACHKLISPCVAGIEHGVLTSARK